MISGFLKHALRASVGVVAGQAEVQVFSLDIATVLLEHGLGVYSPWPKQYVYSRVPSSAITIVPLSCHQELSYSEL